VVGINAAAAVGRSEEKLSDAAPQPPSTGLISDQSRLVFMLKTGGSVWFGRCRVCAMQHGACQVAVST
jgi:hypothetical protein